KERLLRISDYSRACLHALRDETGIEYEGRQKGTLQLFRTQQQLDAATLDVEALKAAGVAHELLAPADMLRVEPGLAASVHKFVGGLRTPGDETGDCHIFTTRLAAIAAKLGVQFHYGTSIDAIETSANAMT